MDAFVVLTDAFQRIRALVPRTLDGLDRDALTWRPDPDANTIAWLVWHLTRIQDDHLAGAAGGGQVWTEADWASRFGLETGAMDLGYGHSTEEVGRIRPDGVQPLLEYHDHVADRTARKLGALAAGDLDRVLDASYDPPVTVGARLVSVIGDGLQHLGQAAYVRGLYERRRPV